MALGTQGTGDIVVEDGSGYSNSDSLASVEFADAFLLIVEPDSAWHDVATLPTTKGTALRKATMEWLEGQYQGRFRGSISVTDQFLSIPRIGLYDDEGRSYTSSEVPVKFQQAIALVAHDIVINSTTVLPTGVVRSATIVEDTKKLGTMQKTTKWSSDGAQSESALVAYLAAEALVYPFIEESGNNGVTVF